MASNTRSSRSSEIRYQLDMNKEFRSALKEETDGKERELIKLLSREEQTAEYKAYTKHLMKYVEKLHNDKEYLEAVVIEEERLVRKPLCPNRSRRLRKYKGYLEGLKRERVYLNKVRDPFGLNQIVKIVLLSILKIEENIPMKLNI